MTKRMIVIININIQQAITMINFQEHKYWLGFHGQTNRPSFFAFACIKPCKTNIRENDVVGDQ
jgi:hypothetical protein